jgi:hypothetical protein
MSLEKIEHCWTSSHPQSTWALGRHGAPITASNMAPAKPIPGRKNREGLCIAWGNRWATTSLSTFRLRHSWQSWHFHISVYQILISALWNKCYCLLCTNDRTETESSGNLPTVLEGYSKNEKPRSLSVPSQGRIFLIIEETFRSTVPKWH